MSNRSRALLGVASLLLLTMYVTPMWQITLEAPQYPEGLGLRIHIDNIDGVKRHDLQNINNLNHYIGMKRIEPDSIKELQIMPWVIAFLIGFGLIGAITGKRWLLYTWTVLFVLLAIAGLVDFYLWAYDYGHNLDVEHAAIKVPGMTYQPPIIGSKKLLNFTAHSWPAFGGWMAFLSMAIGIVLSWSSLRVAKSKPALPGLGIAAVLLLATGCEPAPEPFVLGEDQGIHCRMSITDARFASQVVMTTGKVLKFDSIECMRDYVSAGSVEPQNVHSSWVSDFEERTLVNVNDATFVHSEQIRSPMAGGLVALGSAEAAEALANTVDGTLLDWPSVLQRSLTSAANASH